MNQAIPPIMNWTSIVAQIQKSGTVAIILFLGLYILFNEYKGVQLEKNACNEEIIKMYQKDKELDRGERKLLMETLKGISEQLKKNG